MSKNLKDNQLNIIIDILNIGAEERIKLNGIPREILTDKTIGWWDAIAWYQVQIREMFNITDEDLERAD